MKCFSPMHFPGQPLPIRCGGCPSCRAHKAQEWAFRLYCEYKKNPVAIFLTLTYSDDDVKTISKRDLQLFLKRYRKTVYPSGRRYFGCGEYGDTTGRPHYHLVIFGANRSDIPFIESAWPYGLTNVKPLTLARIKYTAGYTSKKVSKGSRVDDGLEPPFLLMSRRPGIGFEFMSEHPVDFAREFTHVMGMKTHIPSYIQKRFLSQEEMDKRAQSRVDKYYENGLPMPQSYEEFCQNEYNFKSKTALRKKRS